MKNIKRFLMLAFYITSIALVSSSAFGASMIHGMRFPELSPDGSRLVFSYQGDLWQVSAKGGEAFRLTAHDAYEGRSKFSPDGKQLAFESNRFGNRDIFVMASDGSNEPRRITWMSFSNSLSGWYPDGSALITLFPGPMYQNNMARQDLTGGMPIPLFVDYEDHSYPNVTHDGKLIYYLREPGWVDAWRTGYKGSADADIWSYNLVTKEHKMIYSDNRSQHGLLIGHDETYLIFVDYVNQGSSNLAKYDLKTGTLTPLTNYSEDTVRNPSIDRNGAIVYEYMNDLYRIEPGKSPEKLAIYASAEDKVNQTELRTLTAGIDGGISVSPDNKIVAAGIQGDMFAYRSDGKVDKKGVTLADTSDKLESEPVFSKDGKSVYYFVNEGYGSKLVKQDLKTMAKTDLIPGPEVMHNLQRVPTTDLLSFVKDTGDIMVFNPETKTSDSLAKRLCYICGWNSPMSWSPDGKYLAFTDESDYIDEIYVIERETKQVWDISHEYIQDSGPIFSPDGRWLTYRTFKDGRGDIKLIELNPKAEVDETQLIDEEKKDEEKKKEGSKAATEVKPEEKTKAESETPSDQVKEEEKKEEEKKVEVKINFDRIDERARVMNVTPGINSPLGFSFDGEWLYYTNVVYDENWQLIKSELWKVPTSKKPKDPPQNLGPGPDYFIYTNDSIFALMQGKLFKFTDAPISEEVPFVVQRNVDTKKETKLAYLLAGEFLKEGFYDEKMHGASWEKVRQKYLDMLNDARTPEDVTALMNRLNGELNASHLYAYGPSSFKGQPDDTASLGLEWDTNYGGPGLKVKRVYRDSAADKTDIDIKPGDIVLKIDGKEYDNRHDPAVYLNMKADKVIKLTVKGEKENHEVKIKSKNMMDLYSGAYLTWVDENRKLVDKLSNGKLGYLHIEWMGPAQLAKFEKEFHNLTKEKKGVVIDVRFNPGGNISEQLLDIIAQRQWGFSRTRGLEDFIPQPFTYTRVPTIMLINEACYSDGEIFPYGYKQLGLGKLVGMETYGAVIGTTEAGLPGGYMIRIPCEGWYRLNLKNLENEGVKPDIEVPWPPDAIQKGIDPQIETAVKELMKQL